MVVQGKADVIWASELRDRVNLNIKSDPTAFLTFMGVEEQDKGMYRYCMFLFRNLEIPDLERIIPYPS